MKPQELRIGNAVMCQCRGEYKPHTIRSIWYNDDENLYFVELDNGFQTNVKGITPIPITDELLLKIGFTDNGIGQFYYHFKDKCKTTIRCATDDYKGWIVMVESMRYHNFIYIDASNDNVQYIHELQNVIQMAKVNKEIEL